MAWLDTGTHESLFEAGLFHPNHRAASRVEDRLSGGDRVPSGIINIDRVEELAQPVLKSGYGQYLLSLRHSRITSLTGTNNMVEETALVGCSCLDGGCLSRSSRCLSGDMVPARNVRGRTTVELGAG